MTKKLEWESHPITPFIVFAAIPAALFAYYASVIAISAVIVSY